MIYNYLEIFSLHLNYVYDKISRQWNIMISLKFMKSADQQ
jgi:hypothetical protein